MELAQLKFRCAAKKDKEEEIGKDTSEEVKCEQREIGEMLLLPPPACALLAGLLWMLKASPGCIGAAGF
jgi:hypothetical protein